MSGLADFIWLYLGGAALVVAGIWFILEGIREYAQGKKKVIDAAAMIGLGAFVVITIISAMINRILGS